MYNLEKRENYLFILMFVFPYIYFFGALLIKEVNIVKKLQRPSSSLQIERP